MQNPLPSICKPHGPKKRNRPLYAYNEDNPSAGPELLKRRFQLQCFYDLNFASFGKSFNSCDEGINKYSPLSPKTFPGYFASEKKSLSAKEA
ncbi:MAG: hypothetical protein NT168_01920 [Planctomycetota bacterium]|nr:hypothetical protein [Planctomycetota bacterium]